MPCPTVQSFFTKLPFRLRKTFPVRAEINTDGFASPGYDLTHYVGARDPVISVHAHSVTLGIANSA